MATAYLGVGLLFFVPAGIVLILIMLTAGFAHARGSDGFPLALSRACWIVALLVAAAFVTLLVYFGPLGCHLDTGCG